MSVYASFAIFDGEEDDYPAPLEYKGSHILPSTVGDERTGCFELGFIPGFIRRDGNDTDGESNENLWPYLRVSLIGSDAQPDTVVLERDQVLSLVSELQWWLSRVDESRD